jgi:hypothetical protein
VHIDFWWGKFKESDHLRGLGVDGRTVLERIFINRMRVGVDWIDMARDTNKWWAFVNSGMNLRVP